MQYDRLVERLREKALAVNMTEVFLLLTAAADALENQQNEIDALVATLERRADQQEILQQIWDQDGFVDEDLKGLIRLQVKT